MAARLALLAVLLAAPAVLAAAAPAQHWQSAGGIPVYFIRAPELPMVDFRVVFRAGSARDGAAPGTAWLTAQLLTDAAGGRDAERVRSRLARAGARLSAGVDRDAAWVQLRSLSGEQALDTVLPLLAAAVKAPAFEPAAVQRERARLIAEIRQRRQQAAARAQDAFHARLFAGHPYASPPRGEPEAVQGLDSEALAAFHRRYYLGGNALLAIVGDLTPAEARARAEALLSGLAPGTPPPLPRVEAMGTRGRVHVAADISQTHLVLGQLSLPYTHPDYEALYLGNHILGGGILVSRLFEQVREKRGLAYGASSTVQPMLAGSVFRAALATRAPEAEQALAVARRTIAELVETGPEEAEFERARSNLLGGYPLRIDSNRKKLAYLTDIALHGLPLDYMETFPERIRAVTREAVAQALRRHLDPAGMLVLSLGPEPPAAP